MKKISIPLIFLLLALAVATIIIINDGLHDRVAKADVAIVLGSMVHPDGSMSPRLKARLDKAVALYREGLFPRVIVSGGFGAEGHDEATIMHNYLLTQNIPESAILQDHHGDNTMATAKNAAILMHQNNYKSALIITQYFHIFRSRWALKSQSISPIYTAHPDFFEWRDIYSSLREVIASASYMLKNKA